MDTTAAAVEHGDEIILTDGTRFTVGHIAPSTHRDRDGRPQRKLTSTHGLTVHLNHTDSVKVVTR